MKFTDTELEEILNQLIASTRSPRGRFSAAASYPELEKRLKSHTRHLTLIRTFSAAAAVALLCLSVWTAYLYMQPAAIQTISTLAETRTVRLPDGSSVMLNHYSSLSYPEKFQSDKREVELNGEAYFEVAKNKKIPFFVNTEINRVKVVGTHFNVCAYKGSNEFETTLIEGIVDIYPIGSDQVITRLTKDEFFGSYNGKYKKTTLPSYEYLRWKEGLYCFDDAPFNSLLNKLEKYYNVNISVRNLNILNYRCTGKFKEQDGIEHILKVIQKDHKFTYSINEEKDSIIIE